MSFFADRWREGHGRAVCKVGGAAAVYKAPLWGLPSEIKAGALIGPGHSRSAWSTQSHGHLSLLNCSEEYRSSMEISRYFHFSACLELVSSLGSE